MKKSFSSVIDYVTDDACTKLETFLRSKVDANDGEVLLKEARSALKASVEFTITRVLLLEMHAARLTGALSTGTPEAQFDEFVAHALTPAFFAHLDRRYPVLKPRLDGVLETGRTAVETLVCRMLSDRDEIRARFGVRCDRLVAVQLGLGDPHNGGQAVARLVFVDGSVLYKPRSMRLDTALDAFLAKLFAASPRRIYVPQALDRGSYGWCEFVEHRYCTGDGELVDFYTNIGRWVAVLHLLGGTDIHYENLIAAGPVPVVVDPEGLFARVVDDTPPERGHAYNMAMRLIHFSVLRTGLVPYRSAHLAFKGVDISAIGALSGQQPEIAAPALVDDGTVNARISQRMIRAAPSRNHPSERPDIERYWPNILDGFASTTEMLRDLDEKDALAPLLEGFHGGHTRDILRPTQLYVEMMRMLWHPASLHDPEAATSRARGLLGRTAAMLSISPGQIEGEIASLCRRDIPMFGGVVTAPRVASTLQRWRESKVQIQEQVLRCAMFTARMNGYSDEASKTGAVAARPRRLVDLDAKRRELAGRAVTRLVHASVRGRDATVSWISATSGPDGWKVAPVGFDIYSGLGGIAYALAGYRHEVQNDRADPVQGVDEVLHGALEMMRLAEAEEPLAGPGGFIGLGSRISAWLLLHGLVQEPGLLDGAVRNAERLREGMGTDAEFDLLGGTSGSIVPLLNLSEATGDPAWTLLAAQVAVGLESAAAVDEEGARWVNHTFGRPVGGFSHGVTGIGWSLARLALSPAIVEAQRRRWATLAGRAFSFENTLYDERCGGWRDLRVDHATFSADAWCHGSVGIGLAAADLYARTGDLFHRDLLRRASASAYARGWRHGHTLCHGNLGMLELLRRQDRLDPGMAPSSLRSDQERVLAAIEESMDEKNSTMPETFLPGLMMGIAGTVHGLNTMHPRCPLASPLLMEWRSVAPVPA